MAGDWIKMRCNLDSDPRVMRIAESLGVPELHVVGMLWKFWAWADAHTIDGNAPSVTEKMIDRFTCDRFAFHLRECGWLVVSETGLAVPHFDEHNGQTAKARALTQSRVQRYRNARSVTEALPEKRREEKSRSIHLSPPQNGISGPAFDEFWRTYPKRVGPAAAKKAFAKLPDKQRVIAAAKAYAEAVATWPDSDKQYVPHPATWLNRGSYDDDPATWQRTGGQSASVLATAADSVRTPGWGREFRPEQAAAASALELEAK